MNNLKKIVAIGPESTGKSTLCQQLAAYYNTLWCPEYAREYLLANGAQYNYDDLLTIAKEQLALEDEIVNRQLSIVNRETTEVRREIADVNRESSIVNGESTEVNEQADTAKQASCPPLGDEGSLLFIDTDMYIMKVWCEYVYHKCHPFILEQIAERKYDLYLLCNPDLAWEPDILREYPDEASRVELYGIYKNLLLNQATPFVEITGNYGERLQKAIVAIDTAFAP